MITVKGRELIIPRSERQIGTPYDNNAEVRHIRIDRVTSGGIDIANLNYRLDLEYANNVLDTCLLDVEVQEEYILLTWTIPDTCLTQKGTVWIAVRAYDENGSIKWATNRGAVYVGHTIFDGPAYTGKLSELEQLEERITQKTEILDANESERKEAEEQRKVNEERRVNNEAEWQRQAETAINTANETLREAKEQAGIATQKATESTQKAKESSDSATAAAGSAATASEKEAVATQKAKEASDSATAAAGSAAVAGEKEATATQKAKESSDSATAAAGSAVVAGEKEATATQKAAEAKNSADDAKRYAEQCAGVAGFDGTASTVSAIDTQGVAVRKASGTGHVTMTDAAEHPLLNLDIAGKSEQMVTTGAQLLDLVDMTDISAGGAAISGDSGAYTISGTGTLTGAFSASYRLDYLKSQLKPGNLTLRSDLTIPKMYVRIWDGNTVFAEMQGNSTKQITQDMIDNENVHVECFFHGNAGSTITPGTYHPMLYQSGDGTWEPYTGGKPSPSPEYPQEIVSTDVTAVTVTGANNQSKTASITLTEPLRGMGDVRDRIMCRDGVWGIERYVALRELTEGIVYSNQGGQVTPNNIIDNRYVAIWTDNYKGIISKTAYADSRLTAGYCNIAGAGKVGEWNKASGGKENIYTINSNGNIFVTVPIGVLGIGVDVGIDEVNAAVKQYVADHDVYVMFERATPTWEPLPSAAQSALNALTTYTGTTHVTVTAGGPEPDVGLEYFGQPGDKVTVQDMCDSFSAPGFDDSGVVEEITSFQSFYDKFVSGMKIRDFFRNLKAGLKFVLHTGQLVNNGLCNEPGKYPLDAAYGRTLLEMIGNTANLPGGAADIVSAIVTQNSNLSNVSDTATTANAKVTLNGVKNINGFTSVYPDRVDRAIQLQYDSGEIASITFNNTGLAYDFYNGATWEQVWKFNRPT
nr:MAG TPA: hypothetical protein [Caudoviricetes sp.]